MQRKVEYNLYENHLKDRIVEFCRMANIPIHNGAYQRQHKSLLQKFIQSENKRNRLETRKLEKMSENKFDTIMRIALKNAEDSPIEEYLLQALITNKISCYFETQYPIGKYAVDFACKESMLVVECDGQEYHFTEKAQIERDQRRDKYLSRKGWKVLHFDGLTLRRRMPFVIEKIKNNLKLNGGI